jgi:hypothetical protein
MGDNEYETVEEMFVQLGSGVACTSDTLTTPSSSVNVKPEPEKATTGPRSPPAGTATPFGGDRSAFAPPQRPPFLIPLVPVTAHLERYPRRFVRKLGRLVPRRRGATGDDDRPPRRIAVHLIGAMRRATAWRSVMASHAPVRSVIRTVTFDRVSPVAQPAWRCRESGSRRPGSVSGRA